MKTFSPILFLAVIIMWPCTKMDDWRDEYLVHERSRKLIIQKKFDYKEGEFILADIDSTIELYNEKGQLLGIYDRTFYKYDETGKLILIEGCMRSCEKPDKEFYYYDSLNRLIKISDIDHNGKERVYQQFFYNEKGLLVEEQRGTESIITITYTYDSLSRKVSETKTEFNTNVDKWLTTIDSMFYGIDNKVIFKKRRPLDKDILTISKFTYQDTLIVSQIDTTFTSLPTLWPKPNTIHHGYYFRKDFKYNSDNKIIERITYGPDYVTPVWKTVYEYH